MSRSAWSWQSPNFSAEMTNDAFVPMTRNVKRPTRYINRRIRNSARRIS